MIIGNVVPTKVSNFQIKKIVTRILLFIFEFCIRHVNIFYEWRNISNNKQRYLQWYFYKIETNFFFKWSKQSIDKVGPFLLRRFVQYLYDKMAKPKKSQSSDGSCLQEYETRKKSFRCFQPFFIKMAYLRNYDR